MDLFSSTCHDFIQMAVGKVTDMTHFIIFYFLFDIFYSIPD